MESVTFQRIYEILRVQHGYISTKELATQLGKQQARDLRRHGGVDGILHQASKWIAENHGMVIIRTMSPGGIKLSANLTEIRAAKSQWNGFSSKIKNVVTQYEEAEKFLFQKRKRIADENQMALGI